MSKKNLDDLQAAIGMLQGIAERASKELEEEDDPEEGAEDNSDEDEGAEDGGADDGGDDPDKKRMIAINEMLEKLQIQAREKLGGGD